MTGIERLRKLSEDIAHQNLWDVLMSGREDDWDCEECDGKTASGTVAAIAYQIEREAQTPFSRVRVLAVISDMESRVSDEWGSFGALVVRWARELRGAVCGGEHDPAEDVSVSAYDLLPEEEREAIAWVREHGGLENVKASLAALELFAEGIEMDTGRVFYAESMGERCAALRNEVKSRLMPEDCEWPRFEDGEPVKFGEEAIGFVRKPSFIVDHVTIFVGGEATVCSGVNYGSGKVENFVRVYPGKRVKRPAVLAGDGEPLEVGQTVWDTNGDELVIGAIEDGGHTVTCRYVDVGDGIPVHGMWSPSDLTHQRPVLDADGVPIHEGDTVWHIKTGREYVVVEPSYGETVVVRLAKYDDAEGEQYAPDQLTHTKPEQQNARFGPRTVAAFHREIAGGDSWERIEEDATLGVNSYRERYGIKKHDGMTWPQLVREDLVRRCRALAERERGEQWKST